MNPFIKINGPDELKFTDLAIGQPFLKRAQLYIKSSSLCALNLSEDKVESFDEFSMCLLATLEIKIIK